MPSCCPFATPSVQVPRITNLGVSGMFDVYVRGKSQLLVIRQGAPLPVGFQRGWKRKRAARAVSDDISASVLLTGFYERSQTRPSDDRRARELQP
jgi:hypothetical protein